MNFEEVYEKYLNYVSKRHKKLGWQNYIYDLNFKNSYNDKLLIELKKFLKFWHNYYDIDESIYLTLEPFVKKCEDNKSDFYTIQEFNKFIKYVDNEIYKQFFTFMFFTGTRPGETFALQFKDIKDDYISINKTLTSHNGREFDTPKSYNSIRKIKLDKMLKKDIFDLKKYYNDWNQDYFIFGGSKPLAPTTINRYKLKACKKANLRPITLHQFRHSHATLLVNNNILINEVSRRLGHSNVSITLNTYVHTDLSQEKRVYNTLNSMRFNFFNSTTSIFKKFISLLKHFAMF